MPTSQFLRSPFLLINTLWGRAFFLLHQQHRNSKRRQKRYLILEDNLLTCLQTHYPSHSSLASLKESGGKNEGKNKAGA